MSKIKNIANQVTDKININRAQIEHRATWMALIFDEMRKAGVENAAHIIRKAIKRTGNYHGSLFKAQCADPNNCVDFRNAFLGDDGVKTFNMDNITADHDNINVDFHYCALVSAWAKQGFDEETIALLCDMAMDGDRGIAEAMGLELDLGDTIAKGCATCKLHFKKK